ncbi:type II secretion system protein GspE [Candidatus Parcubacteria bacterium]|nr:MAG: type II secretion system protein GspE [Candidatus Parcubacteria bacterium]
MTDQNQQNVQTNRDVINMVNRIIATAVNENVSDIHIEPNQKGLVVRFRVDGLLKIVAEIPAAMVHPLTARIKILSQMDTTGLPRPQEGNMKFAFEGQKQVDLRVSIFPTSYGECIVMRILESVKEFGDYQKLGLTKEQSELLGETIKKPYGLVLVTGPTGSGKSTTLFTLLDRLNDVGRSLVTLEDPVERKLDMVRQTQIDPDIGLTFASGLRYLLRQDSDVIMVGEIRDPETAQIAVQASITGQLVLATIHTNNAAGSIIRLINMGIEPFLLTSALRLVTAQRLARRNCPNCAEEYTPSPELIAKAGAKPGETFRRSRGCEKCNNKGVIGRFGIHEVLPITEKIEAAAYDNPSDDHIMEIARSEGMVTLHDVAMEKAREGLISLEEVLRLTE